GGAALIFDEMITGFRIGPGGAQEHFGVRADLATYGKIIGGGMPIGVVAGQRDVMDRVDGGAWLFGDRSFPSVENTFLAGTFSKHPLSMAAARAVLRHIHDDAERAYAPLNQRTAHLTDSLNNLFERTRVPIHAARFGSLFRFEFAGNQDVFLYHMLDQGIFIWEGRNCFLSTAHTDAHVQSILAAAEHAIDQMKAGGYFAAETTSVPVEPTTFPLTPEQEQLRVLGRWSDAASAAYNETILVSCEEPLDPSAVRAALRAVVQKHEALRTVLDSAGTTQTVLHEVEPDLSLTTVPDEMAAQAAQSSFVARPFHLAGAPLFRALLMTSADRQYLALCAHHLVADGQSLGQILEDCSGFYVDALAGRRLEVPSVDGFRAFRTRQAARLEQRAENLAFWLERLTPLPPASDLSGDRRRPPVRTFGGGAVDVTLDPELVQKVQIAAQQTRSTVYMQLLAAYLLLLHRWTARTDLLIGIPTSGRETEQDAHLVGSCAHMLPLRSRHERTQTLVDYFRCLRDELLTSYQHTDVSFAELLERLALPFDPSRPALFSATFNLDAADALSGVLPVGSRFVLPPVCHTKFDLAMNVTRLGQEYVVRLEYATDLFDAGFAGRFLAQYQRLLSALVDGPQQRLPEVDLWSEDEARTLLHDRNATEQSAAAFPDVGSWFRAVATQQGSREAVRAEDASLTYRDIDRRADALAHYLSGLGVGPESPVGICLDPGVDLPVALLGVLKAGGCYVPLDPDYPPTRLQLIAEDVGLQWILTRRRLLPRLAEAVRGRIILVDDLQAVPTTERAIPTSIDPEQLAYIIHTSGSTGKPKGVGVPHRALMNLVASITREPGFRAGERLLSVTSLSFDIAALEIFVPLLNGGSIVFVPSDTRWNGKELARTIAEAHPDLMQATPSTWRLLLDSGWTGQAGLRMLTGGEELPPSLARELVPFGSELWNMYGPTETTVWSSTRHIARPSQPVDLGLPLANTRLFVVDADLFPVPPGVPGELAIGGAGVARGYIGQPALTAERFVPDPFGARPGDRLYRTGDRVRLTHESQLEFLGRIDDQVKIRGQRIEPREIAGALERHPAIRQAAVVPLSGAAGPELVAFFVATAGSVPSPAELRAHLEAELPRSMVPARFQPIERLPLSHNGKLDVRALQSVMLSQDTSGPKPTNDPPSTVLEAALLRTWEQVLGQTGLGIDDNFFDVGGNSLTLARVHAKTENLLGREFPLVETLKFPTIRALASYLAPDGPDAQADDLDQAIDRARRRRLALTRENGSGVR
ncbi:MAG TPA: amino acid adenylation domain-containing protein, partial [Chloroflexota bacterium]